MQAILDLPLILDSEMRASTTGLVSCKMCLRRLPLPHRLLALGGASCRSGYSSVPAVFRRLLSQLAPCSVFTLNSRSALETMGLRIDDRQWKSQQTRSYRWCRARWVGDGHAIGTCRRARYGARKTELGRRPDSDLYSRWLSVRYWANFFLYPRVLSEIFASVGRDLMHEVPMTRLDPQYRISFGAGGRLDATPNLESMEDQIAILSPGDRGAITRYINDNRAKLDKFRIVLESAFNSPLDLLSPGVLKGAPEFEAMAVVGH